MTGGILSILDVVLLPFVIFLIVMSISGVKYSLCQEVNIKVPPEFNISGTFKDWFDTDMLAEPLNIESDTKIISEDGNKVVLEMDISHDFRRLAFNSAIKKCLNSTFPSHWNFTFC